MIEQSIYSRADNNHINANHQRVYMGYGRMAYSSGFENIGGYLDQNVSTYPNLVPDALGTLPPVMSMYEMDIADGRVHVLQQVVPLGIGQGRHFHIAHMYAATDESSIQTMVAKPLNWMQLNYQSVQCEPIDYPVAASSSMPLAVKFNPGTLAETLKYFNMSPANFELLLCSLFEVRKYDAVFSLVLFDDRRPGYYDWIRRLIVHIYTFLPFEMRRRIGFETWFTGRLMAGAVNLGFASMRCFGREGNRCSLLSGANQKYDVTHCAVFSGSGYLCQSSEEYSINFTGNSSYRSFIHPWIVQALSPQKCAEAERNLNQYWLLYDGTPAGSAACGLEDFEYLILYDQMLRNVFFPDWKDLPDFAGRFCDAMGSNGQKLLASRLNTALSSSGMDDSMIDTLCTLLDADRFGMGVFQCAASYMKDSFMTLSVDVQRLSTLLRMTKQGLLPLSPEVVVALLNHARATQGDWDSVEFMLKTADDVELTAMNDEGRMAALSRAIAFLPERIPADERTGKVLERAIKLSEPGRSVFIPEYIRRLEPSVDWIQSRMEPLMKCCQDQRVYDCCVEFTVNAAATDALSVDERLDILQLACLLFKQNDAMRLADMLVDRFDLEHADPEAVPRVLDVLRHVTQEFDLPASVMEAALNVMLRNDAIPVSLRVRTALEKAPDLCVGALAAFFESQANEASLTIQEFSRLCELFPRIPEALSLPYLNLLSRSLSDQGMDQGDLNMAITVMAGLPQAAQQRLVPQLLAHIAEHPSEDGYTYLRTVLTAFPPQPIFANVGCAALQSIEALGVADDRAVEHFTAIIDHYRDNADVFLPCWERLLSLLPLGSGDAGQYLLLMRKAHDLRVGTPVFADAVLEKLTDNLKNQRFSVDDSQKLIEEAIQSLDQNSADIARLLFIGMQPKDDAQTDAMLTEFLVLTERLSTDEWLEECFDHMASMMQSGAVGQTNLSICLQRCAVGRIRPGRRFLLAMIDSVDKLDVTPVEKLSLLVASEAIDDDTPGQIVRTTAMEIVRDHRFDMNDIIRWQKNDEFAGRRLHRPVLLGMLKRAEVPASGSQERSARWIIENMQSEDEELSAAATQLYQGMIGRLHLEDIGQIAEMLHDSTLPNADSMLASAISSLDDSRHDPARIIQIDNLLRWPDLAQKWPNTERELKNAVERLMKNMSFSELLSVAEREPCQSIQDAILRWTRKRAKELPEALNQNKAQFGVLYGGSTSPEKVDRLLEDCSRVVHLFGDGEETVQIITDILKCVDCGKIVDLTWFLDKLLFIRTSPADDNALMENKCRQTIVKEAVLATHESSLYPQYSAVLKGLVCTAAQNMHVLIGKGQEADVHLSQWLLSYPQNGLDINSDETSALLDALEGSDYLKGDSTFVLYALLRSPSETLRQRAEKNVCDSIVRRATLSLQKGNLDIKRWLKFIAPIEEMTTRRRILAKCVCTLDEERTGTGVGFLSADVLSEFLRGYLSWKIGLLPTPKEKQDRFTYVIMLLTSLMKEIETREQDERITERQTNTLLSFCRKNTEVYLKDTDLMLRTLQICAENPEVDQDGLVCCVNALFPLKTLNKHNKQMLTDFFGVCVNSSFGEAIKRLNGSEPDVCVHYLSWRALAVAWNAINIAYRGDSRLLDFLQIKERIDILCGWWQLLKRCTNDSRWVSIRQDGFDIICQQYFKTVNLSISSAQFALKFPSELISGEIGWDNTSIETQYLRLKCFTNIDQCKRGNKESIERNNLLKNERWKEEWEKNLKKYPSIVLERIQKAYENAPQFYK